LAFQTQISPVCLFQAQDSSISSQVEEGDAADWQPCYKAPVSVPSKQPRTAAILLLQDDVLPTELVGS